MGFFTWTFANRALVETGVGTCFHDYAPYSKLHYGGRGYVQCPDGTVIEEPCYDGYGIFGGKDVFDLVVDWNKGRLESALYSKTQHKPDRLYFELAYSVDIGREDLCPDIAKRHVDAGLAAPYLLKDWKRSLGVEITSEDNKGLPNPIKITSCRNPRKKYADLPASISCQ